MVKRVCADCGCIVQTGIAVEDEDRLFCGNYRASHREQSASCDQAGGSCHA